MSKGRAGWLLLRSAPILAAALPLTATLSVAQAPPAEVAPAEAPSAETTPAETQPAEPAAPELPTVPAPPVIRESMDAGTAAPILGRKVQDEGGKAAGRIVDVLVDEAGQARAAVIDLGGFLGLGMRRIAVAWRSLRFNPADGGITILMPADQIGATPEYKPAAAPVVVASPPPT